MSRRGRRQWCYWLSLGAITLVFCIHWMKNNVDSVAEVKSRREHERNIYDKVPKSDWSRNQKTSIKDPRVNQRKAAVTSVRDWPTSRTKSTQLLKRSTTQPLQNIPRTTQSRQVRKLADPTKLKKVIILITQHNIGSSLVTKLFSNPETMVFEEPLFPFGLNCSSNGKYKDSLLGQLLSCNFSNLQPLFAVGFNLSCVPDSAKCVENGLCFADEVLRSYLELCNRLKKLNNSTARANSTLSTCGFPLEATILKEQCKNAKVIFAKVKRICSVDQLQKVYDFLHKRGMDPYVIHLVRDPRSTVYSRTDMSVTESHTICARMRKNLNMTDKHYSGEVPNLIMDGRYMRIRVEDLAVDEIGWARKIYQFIDVAMTLLEIENVLRGKVSMTNKKVKSVDSLQGELANDESSSKQLQKWRADIPFDTVSVVQENCGDVMTALGYLPFKTDAELRNMSLPSFM